MTYYVLSGTLNLYLLAQTHSESTAESQSDVVVVVAVAVAVTDSKLSSVRQSARTSSTAHRAPDATINDISRPGAWPQGQSQSLPQ